MHWVRALFLAGALASSTTSFADDATSIRVVEGGSPNVFVGGSAAARQGDASGGADVGVQGSANVLINGKPALTAGSKTSCGGAVTSGSSTVFVNGKPLAGRGDMASGCAKN